MKIKRIITITAIAFAFSNSIFSQVGIGTTTPASSAELDVTSTTKGFLPPRMTATERAAISSPAAGLMVYQSDGTSGLYYYTGIAWVYIINASGSTLPVANGGTGTTTGSITGTGALTFTAGGTNTDVTITPTGTGNTVLNGDAVVGTASPNASAVLEAASTTKGLLPPRMTNAQRNAIATPAAGLMVWCTNCGSAGELQVYNGTTWTNMVGGSASIGTSVVLIAPGVSKQFLSHNLGADTSLDPHTPVVGLQGAYIQWGNRGPNTTGNASVDWQTAANTANFAAAPTSGSANDAAISGWSTTAAANGSWGATKTVNDPCPTGYRVPTSAEWTGVNSNNTASRTGTFSSGSTNYGAALHYGPNASTKLLTLPAAGFRPYGSGTLDNRGNVGFYWSSTENGTNSCFLAFGSSNVTPADINHRTLGSSLRCIAE